jgi:hypothetical protein
MKRMTEERFAEIELVENEDTRLELYAALETDRALITEAEILMVTVAKHLGQPLAGQYGNELAGDMQAWMERLDD